jgi:glycine/D-amino acid oxidase-like deaminating enzyme
MTASAAQRSGPGAAPIRKIVIVGGGSAGWMTAAPLSQRLAEHCEVVLVESPEIGTIGVGEATLPTIRYFNRALGLDGADFVRRTQATFKLGIEFRDWGHVGNRFFHGFGDYGPTIDGRSPYLHWLRLARSGSTRRPLEDFSVPAVMARHHRFTPPAGELAAAEEATEKAAEAAAEEAAEVREPPERRQLRPRAREQPGKVDAASSSSMAPPPKSPTKFSGGTGGPPAGPMLASAPESAM